MLLRPGTGVTEAAVAYVDDDVVVDATRRHFNPMTYVGRAGLRQMASDIDEVWADFRMDVLEFIDAGDRVVLVVHAVGKGKASGVEIERWNGEVKQRIRESRIRATKNLVDEMLAANPGPKTLVSGAAVGVYGLEQGDAILDEDKRPGTDFFCPGRGGLGSHRKRSDQGRRPRCNGPHWAHPRARVRTC